MPLETYTGPRVAPLLARAQAELGAEAIVVRVDRARLPSGAPYFQLTAADQVTAQELASATRSPTPAARRSNVDQQDRKTPLVVAVVGPTGAGKTTAIAKLAMHPNAFGHSRVGLLSLDTFRGGGAEPLHLYAKLARLPLEVAYTVDDLKRSMRRLRKRQVILVDTPGRGPGNKSDTATIHTMLRQLYPDEVHMALPAGLNGEYARHLVTEYRLLGATHLLGTKLDEQPGDRRVFELAAEQGLPVHWLSDGQDIPDDLKQVTPELLVEPAAGSAAATGACAA